MKRSALADICCPDCNGRLSVFEEQLDEGGAIIEGELRCLSCLSKFPIRKGIPDLMPRGEVEAHKIREMHGWVSLWQKKGMYDISLPDTIFQVPYVDDGPVWSEVARMFEIALEEMDLSGNETILDVGAGQGWTSRYFAERGCKVFAIDIVADEWYGLGRSWALMEHAGVYFEPMLADGERLPFPAGRFDVVFFMAALHHFKHLDSLLKEVYRVLKPGGLLIAAGEPAISIFMTERDVQAMLEETDEGITEQRPKAFQYWWALKQAGFQNVRIDTRETYRTTRAQVSNWIRLARRNLYPAVRTRYKPLAWLVPLLLLALPRTWAGFFMLSVNGANLIIRGYKPELENV
ncbi:MAG TPA: methyltransferase domain-containing protein [Ardenticatenaceae bacterium]|nr:methyltransferase domain-containing protein [Ardenticatenaceae bacterium]